MIGLLLVSLPAALFTFALAALATWALFLNVIGGRAGALALPAPLWVRLFAFAAMAALAFVLGDALLTTAGAIWAKASGR